MPIFYGLIADGIHTHPAATKIAHRSHPKGKHMFLYAVVAASDDYCFVFVAAVVASANIVAVLDVVAAAAAAVAIAAVAIAAVVAVIACCYCCYCCCCCRFC